MVPDSPLILLRSRSPATRRLMQYDTFRRRDRRYHSAVVIRWTRPLSPNAGLAGERQLCQDPVRSSQTLRECRRSGMSLSRRVRPLMAFAVPTSSPRDARMSLLTTRRSHAQIRLNLFGPRTLSRLRLSDARHSSTKLRWLARANWTDCPSSLSRVLLRLRPEDARARAHARTLRRSEMQASL